MAQYSQGDRALTPLFDGFLEVLYVFPVLPKSRHSIVHYPTTRPTRIGAPRPILTGLSYSGPKEVVSDELTDGQSPLS
jgi:hypothetical protein